ncbi:MAG: hypothetical protein WKF94_19285, partial [Solirubrobacteraceae bacterium]
MPTSSPRRRSLVSVGLLLAGASSALTPSPAAAAGSPFTCEASVLRGTLLTAPAIEPLVANRGQACTSSSVGLPNLTAPLGLLTGGVLTASTQRTGAADRSDLQRNFAAAAVADLAVGSLGSLGLPLPLDQVPLPAGLQSVTVDISAVTGPINAGTAPVSGLLPLVPVPLPVNPQLPTSITVDIAAAVRELVKLPTTDLLRIQSASALAGARCVAGRPVTAGQRTVTGVSVLGNAVDVDSFGDRPIIDTQMIDLSRIADLTQVKLPVIDGLTGGLPPLVLAQVTPIVLSAIRALPPVALPIDLLRASIRPGTQTKTADALTQTALEVKITALGQNVVDLVLGEAKVGTAGVDCAPPATAPAPAPA